MFGVPQGSVLGPLLFLIYINDIINSAPNENFVLYADDTNIFIIDSSKSNVYAKANVMLRNVHLYMLSNQLHINMNKCSYMYFDPGKTCARTRVLHTLSINGIKIKHVTNIKFLGIVLDEHLTWAPHVEYLNNKLKSCIGAIKCIKKSIPNSQYLNIYHTLFASHLTYGISVWGGISQTALDPLFITQKRCIRMLFGKEKSFDHPDFYNTCARIKTYSEHTNPNYEKENTKVLFSENELLTVHNMYNYHIIIELFNILKFKRPYSLYKTFQFSTRTGRELYLTQPNNYSKKSENNFFYKSIPMWNELCSIIFEKVTPINIRGDIVCIPGSVVGSDLTASIGSIKNKLKNVLLYIQDQGHVTEWDNRNFELKTYKGPNWTWGI